MNASQARMLQHKRSRAGSAVQKAEKRRNEPPCSKTLPLPKAGEEPAQALQGDGEKEAVVSVQSVRDAVIAPRRLTRSTALRA